MKQKIVFFGSGDYVIPIVEKLKTHGLELVVTTEPQGKFTDYLKKENIPYIYSKLKKEEDTGKVLGSNTTLGILASYGAIIPKKIIDFFPLGILNIHPSLLPKYKGPSPVQFTILNGDKVGGVSIIKLDDKVDHGPIILQKEVILEGNETLQTLTKKLFYEGSNLIEKIVQKIENGEYFEEHLQDEKNEVWTKKITKPDGKIDLLKPLSVSELNRRIRAFFPWPGVYLTASINKSPKNVKLLPQNKIQVEGKNVMSYKDFINGYPEGKEILEKLGVGYAV